MPRSLLADHPPLRALFTPTVRAEIRRQMREGTFAPSHDWYMKYRRGKHVKEKVNWLKEGF
jgi:hypothetical protein